LIDSKDNGWWITESTTWKIFADTEEEARTIWHAYYGEGKDPNTLDMKLKDGDVEADWQYEESVF